MAAKDMAKGDKRGDVMQMQLALFPEPSVQLPKIPSLYEQLMSCAAYAASRETARPHWFGHIRGAGVVRGSCTDEIWKLLRSSYPTKFTHGELMSRTGLARGAVSWALHYLSECGVISTFGDARNQRYQRYQAKPDATLNYTNC